MDDIFNQLKYVMNDTEKSTDFGGMDHTYTPADSTLAFDADDDLMAEIDAFLNPSPAAQKPFTPMPLEERMSSHTKTAPWPVNQNDRFGQPYILETDSSDADNSGQPPVEQAAQQPAVQEPVTPFSEKFEPLSGGGGVKAPATRSTITDKQLRALGRKHLLIMIRDLEKELSQAKEEKENMLLAYRAGVAQKTQAC